MQDGQLNVLGSPAPAAFALPTSACRGFLAVGRLSADTVSALRAGMTALESATGRRFADPARPLLVSVRSGAAVSMPG